MGQQETMLCSCLRALNTFCVFSDESATSLNMLPWQVQGETGLCSRNSGTKRREERRLSWGLEVTADLPLLGSAAVWLWDLFLDTCFSTHLWTEACECGVPVAITVTALGLLAVWPWSLGEPGWGHRLGS